MSRKRYISTEISNDEKVADLADCSLLATLLYTWAIPHMDDWGRITGNIREFKLLVCPGLDISNRDVEEAINHIVNVKLWVRYEVDGKKCISVLNQENWFKHQSYIGKDKRADDSKSSFPTPQNAEEHRETPKNTEEERKTPENPSSFSFSSSLSVSSSVSSDIPISTSSRVGKENPFALFESHKFGKLDDLTREIICDTIDTYTEDWVIRAIKESVKSNKIAWRYVEGILTRWKGTNHPEPWTLEKEEPPKQNNIRQFNNRSTSGKPQLPIIADGQPSMQKTPEEREAMRMKARKLDGKLS